MRAETEAHLRKARAVLAGAAKIIAIELPEIAAREAYLAAFHAAQALISERTGKSPKTHSGVRSEFSKLAQNEPVIERETVRFLTTAYRYKEVADYFLDTDVKAITQAEAEAAVARASSFVESIGEVLGA